MAGTGTGYPLTLRCTKCKVCHEIRGTDGTRLKATGRTKPLACSQRGHGNPRALFFRAEYRCEHCGHVGWSRHSHMLNLLNRAGYYFDRKGVELCQTCKKNPAEPLHKCPFAEDIYSDDDPEHCNCCFDCEGMCVAGI